MKNQTSRVAALAGVAFLLTGAALAQKSTGADQIPGFYNPKTHTFQVKVQPEVDPEASAPKIYTGTFSFDITVKLVTPVASGHELACTAGASVDDLSGTGFYIESASAVAKVTGSSATCTVSIPYSWSLSDGATDSVSLSYDLEIVPTTTNAALAFTSRTHSSELAPIKVPATGVTTAVPISATL